MINSIIILFHYQYVVQNILFHICELKIIMHFIKDHYIFG